VELYNLYSSQNIVKAFGLSRGNEAGRTCGTHDKDNQYIHTFIPNTTRKQATEEAYA
jgi:hypothetical protein